MTPIGRLNADRIYRKRFAPAPKRRAGILCALRQRTLKKKVKWVIGSRFTAQQETLERRLMNMIDEKLNMTQEWDKVFPQSGKTDRRKVTFHNRYGITLAADLYAPKDAAGKLPAIAVSGLFGAVKERSSGLYAQRMAEYGFLTLAFDRLLPARAADSPGMVLPRTSTSKISALRWIFCPYRTMQTRRASGSSASAVGAVWRSMQPYSTPASRPPQP